MRIRKAISVLLAFALIISSSLFTSIVFGANASSIELQLDKNAAKVGEVIKATLNVNDISNFAGYQVNLKYDPEVLQPVNSKGIEYTNTTIPENGTILNNEDYGALPQALHNVDAGILNFGKLYTNLEDYRTDGIAETTGSIAVIYFKVLQEKATSVVFAETKVIPGSNNGTILFDWKGDKINSGYAVVQPGLINSDSQNPVVTSTIALEFDKTSAQVGDIVNATVSFNNIENLSGYQINLKYDPEVLQPVTAAGSAFTKTTFPSGATVITNDEFSRLAIAVNDLQKGILNFACLYSNLDDYRESGISEKTGKLAVISFKVLKGKATTVSFEDSNSMPGAISGTILVDWYGEKYSSYFVKQAGILNKEGQQVINGNVSMEFDKTVVSVGDIITANIKVDGIENFSGYQVALTYDPASLKPVTASGRDYSNSTIPEAGTLLAKSDFAPFAAAGHNLSGGVLSFCKIYADMKSYRESGVAEKSGTIATVRFQVLQAKPIAILFENTEAIKNGISGTVLFDWNGERIISGYTVTQPAVITVNGETVENGVVTLDLDKTTANVGDIIKATLNTDKISNLSGFQVNLKYDPAVLQPVNPVTGVAYDINTNPLAIDTLSNSEYGVIALASHDLKAGILNFSRAYTNLEAFKENGGEESGPLAEIGFKVLKESNTSIIFENSGSMPSAIVGTILFDWDGNRITSGYQVVQPESITSKAQKSSYIKMILDKNKAAVGEIVEASVVVNDIDNLAGYQINIKYDPQVLVPVNAAGVAYTNSTITGASDILVNEEYAAIAVSAHDIENGILNFSRVYTNLEDYRLSGKPEGTGILNKIYFKILKEKETSIKFESTNTMPNGISGTMFFNWNAERIISGYEVIQAEPINAGVVEVTPIPVVTPVPTAYVTPTALVTPIATAYVTPTAAVTPTYTVVVTPTSVVVSPTPVCVSPTPTPAIITPTPVVITPTPVILTPTPVRTLEVTPTPTPTPTPAVPTAVSSPAKDDSYVTIELNKTTAKVDDTITATVKVNNIKNLSGYQLSLTYDPAVLQPITSSGKAYSNSSIPASGNIINNSEYGVMPAASHNITQGRLTFAKVYTTLEDYRASGMPEESGTLAVITFKVLKEGPTTIKLENSPSMPVGYEGTMLFDWFGNRIPTTYKVIQPAKIN